MEEECPPVSPLHVLLVDDHAVFRRGIRKALSLLEKELLVLEAESGAQARSLAPSLDMGIIILDLSLPDCDGVALVSELRGIRGDLPIVALTDEAPKAVLAIRAGASGCLAKTAPADDVVAAVRAVATGEMYVSPVFSEAVVRDLLQPLQLHVSLSKREREIFRMLVEGRRVKEIAAELGISGKTVATHRARIFGKLRVGSTVELVRYAVSHGLTSGP